MENTRIVKQGDILTLHYKITALNGTEIDNTFTGEPIKLSLGHGEMAETLESCLIGMPVGERYVFQLEPWQAFGVSNPELVQQMSLVEFPGNIPVEPGSLVEFTLPNGSLMPGQVKSKDEAFAIVDFNHPLSDSPILFEVEILSVSG